MPDPTHIPDQDRLSQYQQVSTAIYHMLSVAQAGGLSEKRAQKIYHEIMDAYSTMNGSAFWPFRDEIIRVLVTPDSQFPDKDEDDDWRVTGRN
jgi:hypothetical protein